MGRMTLAWLVSLYIFHSRWLTLIITSQFRASGMSVSMGNAMPVPTGASDYQTLTNNEGGVGVFLDAIFRPEYVPKSGYDSGYATRQHSRSHSPSRA